jgi:catechol 2,3-dioxygenase-like lactoylglutathione lyase family enzyme
MEIKRLHHVQISVPASAKDDARRFYGETLGLEEAPRPQSLSDAGRDGVWYRVGDNELHVYFNPELEPFLEQSSRHPAFIVDGLGELRERLQSAGADLEDAIPIQGRERFFCRDPFGNRLEFLAFSA